MNERVYVCHTYYHVYVTFLKELNLPKEKRGQADLILSRMSTDFEALKERVEAVGLFGKVIEFDEKDDKYFLQLAKFKENQGNLLKNLYQRICFTKEFAKLEAPFIPVDFRQYKEVYVYCDSDPVGYYLNQNKIRYHALEDGLNCLKNYDAARYDNRGHFKLKAFLSSKLNLIFVQNGYGKYCIDMEVNDIQAIKYPCPKYVEVPRQPLVEALGEPERQILLRAFIRDIDTLQKQIQECAEAEKKILILTDPLCTPQVRERIFRDIVSMYEKEGTVFLKPHPRDFLDYRKLFSDILQFDAAVPMEILQFFKELHFSKVVGVLTEMTGISFADEIVRLGPDFMDKYEEAHIHRQNEQIY